MTIDRLSQRHAKCIRQLFNSQRHLSNEFSMEFLFASFLARPIDSIRMHFMLTLAQDIRTQNHIHRMLIAHVYTQSIRNSICTTICHLHCYRLLVQQFTEQFSCEFYVL